MFIMRKHFVRTFIQMVLNKGLGIALCFLVAVNALAAKELTLDDIFPADRVLDVQITVDEKDWDTIRYQSRDFESALHESRKVKPPENPYTYVDASVTIDGVEFPKVGLRKKGFLGSLNTTRPSLKIKLNHIDKKVGIDGLTNLTLNNNQQDGSLVSQFMGYALFNAAGSPAPRCAYARVTVNGENLGVYSHVERVRNNLLKRGFGTDKGVLYEATLVDFHKGWEGSFERKTGGDKTGRAKIKQLIKVLEVEHAAGLLKSDDEGIEKAIGELVDLDSFYTFWAIEGLLGYPDGYSGFSNNYFIYLNPETDKSLGGKVGVSEGKGDKFHFIPWGADNLFTKVRSKWDNARAPLSVKTTGLIAYRLYQTPSGRERYRQTLHGILDKHWNEEKLLAKIDRIEAMLKPHLAPSQMVMNKKTKDAVYTFARALEGKREFIRQRRDNIINETADGMPEWKKAPSKPIVFASVGKIKTKFTAKFFAASPRNGTGLGQVEFELTMAGKKVELKNLGVDASWAGGKGKTVKKGKAGKKGIAIRFVGERVDNGKKLSFYLTIDEDKFKVDKAPISSGGKIGGLSVRGQTKLTAASLDEGGKVEGEFEGEIMEMKGLGGDKKSKPKSKGQRREGGKPTGKRELSKREIEAWTALKQSRAWQNASPKEQEKMAEALKSKLDGKDESSDSAGKGK